MTNTRSIAHPQTRADTPAPAGPTPDVELTETQLDQASGGLVNNERKSGGG